MNIVQLKYVVETARVGSMSRASRNLFVAQPNLSRAVKDLEEELGITIFNRSTNGIVVTPDGEEFIRHAREIVAKMENMENFYRVRQPITRRFSICVPRSGYISNAFVAFSNELDGDGYEIYYKETDTYETMREVIDERCDLGIIRYNEEYDNYFRTMLDEKGLVCKDFNTFRYKVAVSKSSELAKHGEVKHSDLEGFYEIAHRNSFFSEFPLSIVQEKDIKRDTENRIYVFERSSQFELLSGNPRTFMWVSPMPDSVLEKYGLVLLDCPENKSEYYDILVHRKGYELTTLDKKFLETLEKSK